MESTCPSCGAENYESARYCRKCGTQLGSSEFHEAPTREFSQQPAPPQSAADAQDYRTFPSGPIHEQGARYVPPPDAPLVPHGMTQAPVRVNTAPMQTGPVKRKTNWLLIVGVVFLALLMVGGITAVVVVHKLQQIANDISKPGPKKIGPVTVNGTDPDKLPAELRGWYYDGARIKNSTVVNLGSKTQKTLIMESDDDPDDVAEFYAEKFQAFPQKTVVNGDHGEHVYSARGTNVVVKPADSGAGSDIVVSIGNFAGDVEIPDIPDVDVEPEVEPPAAPGAPTAVPPAPPAAPRDAPPPPPARPKS